MPSSLRVTVPETWTTHSFRSVAAVLWASEACSGLNTICAMPSRLRRSTNIRLPWSRLRWTQPASVTVVPTCSGRSAPQLMVLSNYSLPVDSVDGAGALANAVRGVPRSVGRPPAGLVKATC